MKLLFEEITGKVHRYTMKDNCWFPQDDEEFLLTAKANITVSRRDSETVLLKGELEGQRSVSCDRCGEQALHKIDSTFVYSITTREEVVQGSDIECCDEDITTLYLQEPEIDLDEILREQSYLAFPLKTLCRKDCKGICAGCGVSLNNESCRCSVRESNSPFAVLKKLTNS